MKTLPKQPSSLDACVAPDAEQRAGFSAAQAAGLLPVPGHPGGIELTKRLLALSGISPPARVLDLGAGAGRTVELLRETGFDAVGIDRQPGGSSVVYGDASRNVSRETFVRSDPSLHDASACGEPPGNCGDGEAFDAVMAECMLSVSGHAAAVLETARSALKPGGKLLVSDVVFEGSGAPRLSLPEPLTELGWRRFMCGHGFAIAAYVDVSELWEDYYLRALWAGQDVFYGCKGRAAQTSHCGCDVGSHQESPYRAGPFPNRVPQSACEHVGAKETRCGYMMMVCQKTVSPANPDVAVAKDSPASLDGRR